MNLEVLSTTRGGTKVKFDGYIYRVKERRDDHIRWKCEEAGCYAALRTDVAMVNPRILGRPHSHGHPEQTVVQAKQLRLAMTRQVTAAPHLAAGQVHREFIAAADPDVVAHVTGAPSVQRSLRRTKALQRPPLPPTAEDLVINEHFAKTKNGLRFLAHDEVFEGDRLLIFASNFLLTLLFSCVDTVFMDGTFQMIPGIFHQLFTLNIMYGRKKQVPVVYVLLKRKTASVYRRVFAVLRELALAQDQTFAPTSMLTDFETGLIRAVREEMPNTFLRGCLFHFSQCIYRKVRQLTK
jgi:hypothetical protein